MGKAGFLLDSHVLIWSLYQRSKLPARYHPVRRSLPVVATVWERRSTGQACPTPYGVRRPMSDTASSRSSKLRSGEAADPPRRPFDRADREGLTILTVDRAFGAYDVSVV